LTKSLTKLDKILIKNDADFANNVYVFKNYILKTIFMPNFRSLANLYQRLTRGRGRDRFTPSLPHPFSVHKKSPFRIGLKG